MKSYMTAEQFEEETAKLQARMDRIINKVNEILMKKTNDLYKQLNKDQQDRLHRRFLAKQQEEAKKLIKHSGIIVPGSTRTN